jgi:carbon monoxide dehydrogenase subunit G
MEFVEGQISIDAAPKAVMEVLADFSTYPEWSGFSSCEVKTQDEQGRASHVAIVLQAGPVNAKYTIAIEYLADDGGLKWSFVEGSGIDDTAGEYRLEPSGDGTVVHYRGGADVKLPLPGFMKKKLLAEGAKIGRDKALKGLKAFVEARG